MRTLTPTLQKHLVEIGKKGGSATSEAKARAAAENGKKGGILAVLSNGGDVAHDGDHCCVYGIHGCMYGWWLLADYGRGEAIADRVNEDDLRGLVSPMEAD